MLKVKALIKCLDDSKSNWRIKTNDKVLNSKQSLESFFFFNLLADKSFSRFHDTKLHNRKSKVYFPDDASSLHWSSSAS